MAAALWGQAELHLTLAILPILPPISPNNA